MNLSAIHRIKIMKLLSFIPDNKLNQLEMYINSILPESLKKDQTNISLKGIWKNKGFDKIDNLDTQINKIRKQFGSNII